jgi:tetratricopeptide (TPR) repeat protein
VTALAPLGVQLPPVSAPPVESETTERRDAQACVGAVERAVHRHEYAEAVALVAHAHAPAKRFPDLALRVLLAESWARMSVGEAAEAGSLLERARALVERDSFSDVDRADVLHRLGCVRVNLNQVANAAALFTLALELCDRSGLPCDRLRAQILDWRSRCYQRQRDWEAARADVERGLELAGALGDTGASAGLYLQASLIAEREGERLLARCYGEQALELYEHAGDRIGAHKLLNNLGGLNFLLGDVERAVACLQDSFRIALELGNDLGAGYAMSSLAQVQLKTGAPEQAETHARRALELLEGRIDHLGELGNAQLVLGRSLLEQGRLEEAASIFDAAESSFATFASASHRAAAWVAQGDLAARSGDTEAAAALYRRAAEALQDFNF